MVAFQASQLPNPVVEVGAAGHGPQRVQAEHTLKPVFADVPPARFPALAPDAVLSVRLLDRKAGAREELLGVASFAAARAAPGRGRGGPRHGHGDPRLGRADRSGSGTPWLL